jgi:hypothetical protein
VNVTTRQLCVSEMNLKMMGDAGRVLVLLIPREFLGFGLVYKFDEPTSSAWQLAQAQASSY